MVPYHCEFLSQLIIRSKDNLVRVHATDIDLSITAPPLKVTVHVDNQKT